MDSVLIGPFVDRLTPLAAPVIVVAPPPAQRPRLGFRLALAALVLLGFGLRTGAFLEDRCLWIDEAMLALNLMERSPAQLLQPLDRNQGAPLGFLLLSKLAVGMFGTEEWCLRLVPFYSSLLGLVGFAWLAPRLLARPAALLAVGLFAVSPTLVSYAGECKQYEMDATAAVGLLTASVGLLRDREGVGRWVVLAAAGALAVWFSHPATFLLAGVGTTFLARTLQRRDRSAFFLSCGMIACWLLSFAVCYFVCLRQLSSNRYLLDYWAGHFLNVPPRSAGDLAWIADRAFSFFREPGGFEESFIPSAGLAAALALAGLYQIARQRWTFAAALTLPVVFTLAASGLHVYPLGGRLLLFFVPSALLMVAAGAGALIEAAGRNGRFVSAAIVGILIAAYLLGTIAQFRNPPRHEEMGPVLAEVQQQWQPGDHLYVYYGAEPAYAYYSIRTPLPKEAVTIGKEHRDNLLAYREELAGLPPGGRFWVLFGHRHGTEEPVIRAYLDDMGRFAKAVRKPGATAYLYERD